MATLPRPPPRTHPAIVGGRRRAPSPPPPPPSWGQAVAPPPTPFSLSPVTGSGEQEHHLQQEQRRPHYHRHKCSHPHHQSGSRHRRHSRRHHHPNHHQHGTSSRSSSSRSGGLPYPDLLPEEEQVVTYTYRFSSEDGGLFRHELPSGRHFQPLPHRPTRSRSHRRSVPLTDPSASWADCEESEYNSSISYLTPRPTLLPAAPYLNSQSSSPVFTESSPDLVASAPHQTSPASPENGEDDDDDSVPIRSALRNFSSSLPGGDRRPAKSVQWRSDVKRRPEDISSDRKVVKHQVSSAGRRKQRHDIRFYVPAITFVDGMEISFQEKWILPASLKRWRWKRRLLWYTYY